MKEKGSFGQGVIFSLSSYVIWGVLPIYWKSIQGVATFEILANRIIWSVVFVGILLKLTGRWPAFVEETRTIIADRRKTAALTAAGLTILVNWGIFIWAVASGHIIETSMGYYINPLVSIVFGVFFLKERLDNWQMAAVICAVIGVGTMVWNLGQLPWVSVSLAVSFALYGLIKKCLSVTTMTSIMLETLLITPLALAYEYYLSLHGTSAYQTAETSTLIMLACAGVVTATPLLFFTAGAKLLPLKIIGFLQYIAPTISLLIGVFMYGENFTSVHMVAFGWIWFGLFLFTIAQIKRR